MRIVHIITRLIVGGAQENTLLSCEGQHDLGHEVTLITGPPLGPEGSLLQSAQSCGYRIEVLDEMRRSILPFKDYFTYRHLVKRLRNLRPEVVHTHSSKAGILGRYAAHAAGIPVIIHTIHGLSWTASRWRAVNAAYRVLERKAAKISTKIVCVADAMRDQSLAANIGSRDQYVTVYSGMRIEPFVRAPEKAAEVRHRLGIADDDVIAGTIARLFELKGHDDLLDIAPALCAQLPKLRFLWVGDGMLRSRFEQRIRQMGLENRFILTGLVPPSQIPELIGAMDLVVHPSRREGLARALAQGALAGKPAVTYDIDGAKEAVIDSRTGYVLTPFDTAALAGAITSLVKDAALRHAMGQEGRALAVGRFDAKVMVESLQNLYQGELRQKEDRKS